MSLFHPLGKCGIMQSRKHKCCKDNKPHEFGEWQYLPSVHVNLLTHEGIWCCECSICGRRQYCTHSSPKPERIRRPREMDEIPKALIDHYEKQGRKLKVISAARRCRAVSDVIMAGYEIEVELLEGEPITPDSGII